MLFIISLILPTMEFITHDNGLSTNFNNLVNSGFVCKNSYQSSQTISFSGSFQNIPQVILQLDTIDIDSGTSEYQLSITSVTLTTFTVKIFCPTTSTRTFKAQFKWYAIDDQRVQVINAFNIVNPTATTTYQHANANALTGILSHTSISYKGPLEFVLSISSITKTSVTVDISNPSGKFINLLQIGYQIVLGTEEVFDILGIQQVTTTSYNSANFNLQANKWFLAHMNGYNFPNTYFMQFRWSLTTTSTTISYKVDSWDQLVKHTHQILWMSYAFNTIYQPLVSQTIRISQKFDLQAPSRPTVYSKLPQTNEIFDQIGTFTTIIDKSIQPVLMEIIMKCSSGKKIKSQFNKCNSCPTQKFYTFNHQCNNQINQISYFPRFITGVVAHQELMIMVSASRILIKQITYNQLKVETTILDIQILDI